MEAQEYEKLVKALRICSSELNCGDCPLLYRDSCSSDELMSDAAAAIEELLESVGMLGEQRSYWIDKAAEYYNQLPKRGEWIDDTTTYAGPGLSNYKCSLCGKIGGTWRRGLKPSELPNWCGNCGADMRKMEVQDES